MAKKTTTSSNKKAKTTTKTASKKIAVKVHVEEPRPVKSILISLPKPETGKSPYIDLATKFKIKLDWRPFTHVEDVKAKEFRNQKIYLDQFKNIIFTSRTSAEQFFRMCEEMRIKISPENKYFCLSEAIALYLQKYIQYRKRKVFFANGKIDNLIEHIKKYKDDTEDILISSSETKDKALNVLLDKTNINYKEAILYKTVASDLSDLSDVKYDMLVFFNPSAIESLYSNFPDFKQDKTRLAIYGNLTAQAVAQHKLKINVFAPLPGTPSLVDAIKKYIEVGNKK